jgi:hypothetical protein
MLSSNKKPAFRRVALDAVNGSPSLHRFVAARFPTDNLRSDLQTRFQIERERGFVLKDNFNDAVIGRDGKFHFGNDFAFCRWKLLDALVRFGSGTLALSHCRLLSGALVRGGSAFRRWPVPTSLIARP